MAWMKLLKEIFRDPGLNLSGRTLERRSAKAIIRQGRRLLMIYSASGGGYKFPGGGVEAGETDEETLAREIREECGVHLMRVEGEFGQVAEYKRPFEADCEVFKLISRYYLCQVQAGEGELRLEAYEQELGYRPRWVEVEQAIQTNRGLLASGSADVPGWVGRETYVLEQVNLLHLS
jgi:8-oxo-dGTP pyrophosphatase MutT (NUDIX family)